MSNWLSRISDARDIRGLSVDQLKELAEEIRDTLLRVTSINGGHLASSLGAVELTIGLHYAFNTPEDKIIWDVGHQGYAHKLLTGRAAQFDSLRTEGGISGFLQRAESPYDAFGAGHASTSISAALGMAMARDRLGKKFRVVSVTGDGAMTGGICYEALNNAGSAGSDLLVVLNDNEMSISTNVGALARYFNRIVTTNFYAQRHQQAIDLVKKLPAGQRLIGMANRVEESVKGLIVPGIFFEELGFRYLGPFDGHNLAELIPILQKVRTLKGPILLHVITTKGKGRAYSEADPVTWHSPPLHFDAESGEAPARQPGPPSFTKIFAQSLIAEARRDERLVAVTAAMLEGTGLARFKEQFPERTYDVGIAEEHAVIAAAGMACEGLRPVVCIYSTFMQRAYDQIIHDVALQKLPVVFSLDRGGLVGSDGPTHHGVFDLSYLRMIPNMVVMAPRDGSELRDMTHTACLYEDGPISIRFPRGSAAEDVDMDAPSNRLEIGRGETLREGEDVCLVGIGNMVGHALEAAKLLDAEGISCGVINARFVKPLDRELLCDAARRHGCLVTVEDNVAAGGFGSAVMEMLAAENIDARVVILGLPDQFIEHGKQSSLYEKYGLSPSRIAETVRAEMKTLRWSGHKKPAATRG
ncbi:MAG: 1-deoxy-D-xylulose-5-phosphate synthase [Candidatus Sumerlaeia bacterium]